MFVGGLTAADLARMRAEKKPKEKETKEKKSGRTRRILRKWTGEQDGARKPFVS